VAVDGASPMNPMIKPESNFLGPCVVSTVLAIRYLVQIFAYLCTISASDAPLWAKGGISYGGYGLYLKPAIFKFITFALNQPSPTN